MKRRCSASGSRTSGMPQITVPKRPCQDGGSRSDRRRASPSITCAPGSRRRRCVTIAGTISTTTSLSAGMPPASSAREITPVPAPSSSTYSSGARAVCATIRLHSAGDDGTTEPICSGLASHRRKNIAGLAAACQSSSPAARASLPVARRRLIASLMCVPSCEALLDLGFLERDVLAHDRIVLVQLELAGRGAGVLLRYIEVPGVRGGHELDLHDVRLRHRLSILAEAGRLKGRNMRMPPLRVKRAGA